MPSLPRSGGCLTSSFGSTLLIVVLVVTVTGAPAWGSDDYDQRVEAARVFVDLQGQCGPVTLVIALALAFAWGAGHALSPGHGKALVGAYLLQSRGRYVDAVWLGLIVTLTHTASVLVLGLIFTWVVQTQQDKGHVFFYLELASAGLVMAFGVWLLVSRTLRLARDSENAGHTHPHPCGPAPAEHDHRHGPISHTHAAVDPDALARFAAGARDPRAKTPLLELLGLGFSGGIVPCPSALVVVLLGLHFKAPWVAMMLVVAFSLGLAGVLVIVGCVLVNGSRLARRSSRATTWLRAAPVFSAVVILAVAAGMAGAAAVNHGVIGARADHGHGHLLWPLSPGVPVDLGTTTP